MKSSDETPSVLHVEDGWVDLSLTKKESIAPSKLSAHGLIVKVKVFI